MDVTEATSTSPATAGDYIKSQTTSATYYDGFGFYPAFNMSPTRGYMLKLADGGTLTYPSGTLASFIDGEMKQTTVLAVVKNNGRIFPYVSTIIMCIGLLFHMLYKLYTKPKKVVA